MDRLDDIERRLAALEARVSAPVLSDPTDEPLWVINGIHQRLPEGAGVVLIAGAVPQGEGHLDWQYGLDVETLQQFDWSEWAGAFSALGSPVRLTLLHRVFTGVHDVAELAQTDGIGTTGQVYHHLRALVAGGWLRTSARGRYEIPPARVVPLLACFVSVTDV